MSREHLATAGELLEDAAEETDGDTADRLREQADALFALADRDRGPDHGRLARIEHALQDVRGAVGDDTAGTIDRALAEVREYRSGVEGV